MLQRPQLQAHVHLLAASPGLLRARAHVLSTHRRSRLAAPALLGHPERANLCNHHQLALIALKHLFGRSAGMHVAAARTF